MVIGPTPPGTGVIAPAMPCASAKATSPTSLDLPSGAGDPVDADIDDDGARLDPVAAHDFRPAHRRDQNIGAAQDRREVAAFWNARPSPCSSRPAATPPSACRRCWSVRARPLRRRSDWAARRATAAGSHRACTAPALGLTAAPQTSDILGVKSVDVLARIDRVDHALRIDVLRQRQLHQNAVDASSALSLAISASSSASLVGRRQVLLEALRCRRRSPPCPCCGHRPGLPDRRRPARRKARARPPTPPSASPRPPRHRRPIGPRAPCRRSVSFRACRRC